VRTLVRSIQSSDFWDYVLARSSPTEPGTYELAYGHHRLAALHEIHGKRSTLMLDIPVRDLDDATMLKIMAGENI